MSGNTHNINISWFHNFEYPLTLDAPERISRSRSLPLSLSLIEMHLAEALPFDSNCKYHIYFIRLLFISLFICRNMFRFPCIGNWFIVFLSLDHSSCVPLARLKIQRNKRNKPSALKTYGSTPSKFGTGLSSLDSIKWRIELITRLISSQFYWIRFYYVFGI